MDLRWPAQATKNSLRNSTKPILASQTHKKLFKEGKERILRKTLEVIERLYLTVDSQFREPAKPKRRRKSPILRKCEELMEILWEDGYRNEIPWHTLRGYVVAVCGGFRTTVSDYLGKRAKYYKSRGREGVLKTPAKQGYLEGFGFIKKKSPKIVSLNHEGVRRSYHCEQSNIVSFSLSNSHKEYERTVGAIAPTNSDKNNNNTKSEREIKKFKQTCQKPTLTSEELRILEASTREGG